MKRLDIVLFYDCLEESTFIIYTQDSKAKVIMMNFG